MKPLKIRAYVRRAAILLWIVGLTCAIFDPVATVPILMSAIFLSIVGTWSNR